MQRPSGPVQKIIHTNRWLLEGLPSGQLSDLRSLEVKPYYIKVTQMGWQWCRSYEMEHLRVWDLSLGVPFAFA